MIVKPNENYELAGTSIKLDENKTYEAVFATNQPRWLKDGKIFVEGLLLKRGEYRIIEQEKEWNIPSLKAVVRFDDRCGNGHNTFSITGTEYDTTKEEFGIKRGRLLASGCLHELIAKAFPGLAPLSKWHRCSTNGPLHYIANTMFWIDEGNLAYARSTAIWPEATDEQLCRDVEIVIKALNDRLPRLLAEFRKAIESLGFMW